MVHTRFFQARKFPSSVYASDIMHNFKRNLLYNCIDNMCKEILSNQMNGNRWHFDVLRGEWKWIQMSTKSRGFINFSGLLEAGHNCINHDLFRINIALFRPFSPYIINICCVAPKLLSFRIPCLALHAHTYAIFTSHLRIAVVNRISGRTILK